MHLALGALVGANVVGSDGDKIGTVGQVYVDPDTGRPNWITVRTGLFGMRESFVPLDAADQNGDEIRVPYSKDVIKGAPNIDHEGALEEDETDNLYSYYERGGTGGYSTGTTGYDTDVRDTDVRDTGVRDTGRTTEGYGTSGPTTDDAMTRSEERLNVGTEKVQTGRARLRKYVVTENETVTVPVSREEVRLEREPITDANVGDALAGPDISEEEHEVILTEERPVIQKETVPVERVRLGTETVTDTERVQAEVRKEEIALEDDTTTTRNNDR
ncbi:DUF2382 domain-containing protein [Micromonospora sp. DT81.3]|uniref:DUF2382 domain-containing protein n=1 Tax=Micromonospora sp. DT81.3 TaxID=3416523 RepID=UPI003CEDC7AB